MNNQFSPFSNPFATAPGIGGNGFGFQEPLGGGQKSQTKQAQSKVFPGLPLYMEKKINDYAFQNSYNENQRKLLANDLYKEALKQKKERDMAQTRQEAIRESYARAQEEQDPTEANKNTSTAKALEVADMIRGHAKENGVNLGELNDMQVLQSFVTKNPDTQDAINNYLRGNQSALDFAESMGFTPPVIQKQEENWIDGTLKSMGVRNVDSSTLLDYLNPVGKVADRMDDQIQGIQGWGDTSEREAEWKARITQVTPEERKKYEEKFAHSQDLQKRYGNVDNYIAENKKGFWDHFWGIGEGGPVLSKMIANAPVSALKTLSGTARAFSNPVDSITGIVKILGTEEGRDLLKKRYGEDLAKTMNEDPVGLASDILAIIQGGAGIGAKGASLLGKAETAGKLANIAQTAGTASDLGVNLLHNKMMGGIDKLSTLGKAGNVVGTALGVSQEPLRAVGVIGKGLLKVLPSAEHTLQNMNRMTKGEQSAFQKMTGTTQGKWMNERGLIAGGEEAIEKLGDYFLNSKKKVDDAMGTIHGEYKNDMLDLMLEDSVRFAKETLSEGAERMSELQKKAKEVGLTMSEINEVKRFYEQNNKFTYGKDITAGEKSVRATNIDNAVREWQIKTAEENGFDNLREMNKETQASKFLLDKLVKNENGRLGNNYFTLTDYITGVGATVNPSMIAVLAGKKIASSNWFRKAYATIVNKINGAETITEKVANIESIKKIQNEKDLNRYLDTTKKDSLGGEEPSPNYPSAQSIQKIDGNASDAYKKMVAGGKEPTTATKDSTLSVEQRNAVSDGSIANLEENASNSYKKIDGTEIKYENRTNIASSELRRRQFSNKFDLPLTENLKPKTQLVDLIKIGELEKGSLGNVPAVAFNDGKVRPLELSTSIYEKIFKKHGPFSHENLIATANDWDYMIKDLNGTEGHINLIKELPDGSALLLGAKRQNGAFVTTHFEPTKSLEKVLKDAEINGGEVIEKGKIAGNLAESKYNGSSILDSNNVINGERGDQIGWNNRDGFEDPSGVLRKSQEQSRGENLRRSASGEDGNFGGGIQQDARRVLEFSNDGDEIVANLERIKANSRDGYKMDIHSPEDYRGWKTFQSPNKKSSVSIKPDGDITSLVSEKGQGMGKELVLTAIENGGIKLDAYDEFLPGFYYKAGFEPVARVKFNPEYAPADRKGPGQDIIVMMRSDFSPNVREKWGSYGELKQKVLDNLPIMEYDEALAHRDKLLEARKAQSGKFGSAQTKDTILANRKGYEGAKQELDSFLDELANTYNGKAIKPSLKFLNNDGTIREDGLKRILEKASKKKGGISEVNDIVRGTVLVKNTENLKAVVQDLKKRGIVFDDKFTNPTSLGYKDISFNYPTSKGIKAETQINIPELIVAKEGENAVKYGILDQKTYDKIVAKAGVKGGLGHKYYEQWRRLDAKLGNLPKEEQKGILEQMRHIEKESSAYYAKFEEK